MKRSILIPIAMVLIVSILSCNQKKENRKKESLTQVLIVGTTHAHDKNPNYTYYDLVNILGTYDPDVICVEIPPSYFRKLPYLNEMMLATIYGLEKDKKVYPIDSWASTTGGNDNARQREYVKTEEFKIKEKQYSDLEASNKIMQNFNKKYGSLYELWNKYDKGYDFFNSAEYNNYIREMYAINISVFGNGCMNMSYLKRNGKMLELISVAIKENKGKRILVLTGAEHKHYFDIGLSKIDSLKVVDFKDILPLKEEKVSKNISDFIEKKLTRGYYDIPDSTCIDLIYQKALNIFIHGMGKDNNPDIVPSKNIEKAKLILEVWEEQNPQSAYLQFEKAWIIFLEGDYKQATTILESISNRLDEMPESRWFIRPFYYRNLGFCYDMLGEREKAIDNYRECKNACKEWNFNESYAKTIFKNYDTKPYKRQMKQ